MKWYKDFWYLFRYFGFKCAWSVGLFPRIVGKFKEGAYRRRQDKALMALLSNFLKDEIEWLKSKPQCITHPLTKKSTIWMCWWQGDSWKENPVIKQCINSVLRNAQGHPVVIITKDNYRRYIDVPEAIIEKMINSKYIHKAHLADLIRCYLLWKYGGIWIDSALFVTQPINLNGEHFFSPKLKKETEYISSFKWVLGCLASSQGSILFEFMYKSLLKYWQENDVPVRYLFMDYVMEIAYRSNSYIKAEIDACPYNNQDIHDSRYTFNEVCDEEKFKKLIDRNQFLSLTWRFPYYERTQSGDLTYYGRLIQNCL